uniref:Uncharacterized protein n=1 Tax=Catagonus wagneri TaxID=51154 RepID=A0A8C3YUN8_9CETA
MPRALKGSSPYRGSLPCGGDALSSTQADSGSSKDKAASEALRRGSECPRLLNTAAEEVPKPGRILLRACAWLWQLTYSLTSC